MDPKLKSYFLPNGGGTYSAIGGGQVTPQNFVPKPVVPAKPAVAAPSLFNNPPAPVQQPAPVNIPQGYVNPETGQLYSAKEIVSNMARKIPISKDTGNVGAYAANAMINPDQSVDTMTRTATNLNNARNDLAVGETKMQDFAPAGITYSPAQQEAIRKAAAGIYDPVLNDVFSRIKAKQQIDKDAADAKTAEAKDKAQRELIVFNTNENIRQWKATTGSKSGSDVSFSQSQINSGASNAGLNIAIFDDLDPDVKNFYINPPKALNDDNKVVPIYQNFEDDIAAVKKGLKTVKEVSDAIDLSPLPESVKHYFIAQLPLTDVEKEGYFQGIWKAVKGK